MTVTTLIDIFFFFLYIKKMFSFNFFSWIIIPIIIFFARIIDVSLGTIRVILLTKGYKIIAPILGFFEVLIWVLIVAEIMKNLNNFICYIAYACGFATGTFIGMLLEEKLSIGTVVIRIISQNDTSYLFNELKRKNYGVTLINGIGARGRVEIIFTIVNKKKIKEIIKIIKNSNPTAFYTIEDIKFVSTSGIFPHDNKKNFFFKLFKPHRKSK